MKRLFALFLAVMLAFALCACGGGSNNPDPGPSPAPGPVPADEGLSLFELWDKLSGVWLNESRNLDFAVFSTEGPEAYLTEGIFFSDGVDGGTVPSVKYADGKYTFDVNVPAVEPNDLNDGHEAYTVKAELTIGESGDTIRLTDFMADGGVYTYKKLAGSMDEVDFDELMYGPAVSADGVWDQLAGVWLAKDGNEMFFLNFHKNGGECRYYGGIPFSGYGYSTVPDVVHDDKASSTWTFQTDFDGQMKYVFIRYDKLADGVIVMNNIGGSDSMLTWKYICKTMDDLTVDMVIEAEKEA